MKTVFVPLGLVFGWMALAAVCPIAGLITIIPLILVMVFGNVVDAMRK